MEEKLREMEDRQKIREMEEKRRETEELKDLEERIIKQTDDETRALLKEEYKRKAQLCK